MEGERLLRPHHDGVGEAAQQHHHARAAMYITPMRLWSTLVIHSRHR